MYVRFGQGPLTPSPQPWCRYAVANAKYVICYYILFSRCKKRGSNPTAAMAEIRRFFLNHFPQLHTQTRWISSSWKFPVLNWKCHCSLRPHITLARAMIFILLRKDLLAAAGRKWSIEHYFLKRDWSCCVWVFSPPEVFMMQVGKGSDTGLPLQKHGIVLVYYALLKVRAFHKATCLFAQIICL